MGNHPGRVIGGDVMGIPPAMQPLLLFTLAG
jgi:hypothetical protein